MNGSLPKLLLIFALGAMTVPARAQETNAYPSPLDELAAKNSLFNKSDNTSAAKKAVQPPSARSGSSPSFGRPLPSTLWGKANPEAQDAANRRNNWLLVTPEEIYGLKTREEIYGVQKPEDVNNKDLSLVEQYLLRKSKPAAASQNQPAGPLPSDGDTGLFSSNPDNQSLFSRDLLVHPNDRDSSSAGAAKNSKTSRSGGKSSAGNSSYPSPSPSSTPGIQWANLFAPPVDTRPNNPEAEASMERFRTLLKPVGAPVTVQASKSIFQPSKSGVDTLAPQASVFDAASRPATAQNDLSQPVGLQPINATVTPDASKRPDWKAQLPPWLSNDPKDRVFKRTF